MPGSIRVLLVEPDPFVRDAIQLALKDDDLSVRCCDSVRAVEEQLVSFVPTLAIVAYQLERGPDGIALTKRLRAWGDISVIIVSGSQDVDDRLAAFAAGADDFMVKPFSMSELRARVGVALRRSNQRNERLLEVGDIVIDQSAHLALANGQPMALRNIEFRLLEMFCRHPGQVLSKVQILEKVWGYSFSDVNLVEVHVSHLRRAMERHGPRVIHTVRSVGYVMQPDRNDYADRRRPEAPNVIDLSDSAASRATSREDEDVHAAADRPLATG